MALETTLSVEFASLCQHSVSTTKNVCTLLPVSINKTCIKCIHYSILVLHINNAWPGW